MKKLLLTLLLSVFYCESGFSDSIPMNKTVDRLLSQYPDIHVTWDETRDTLKRFIHPKNEYMKSLRLCDNIPIICL